MFFHMTKEKAQKREKLKEIIVQSKESGKITEEIKEQIKKSGFNTTMNITSLSGHWEELREFLELSYEEYKELGLPIWMN